MVGVPLAPTATNGTNTTQIATTAFVQSSLTAITGAVTAFNTRTGSITLTSGDVTTALTYVPAGLISPAFTVLPTAPTAAISTSTTQLATTAFVVNEIVNDVAFLRFYDISGGSIGAPTANAKMLSFVAVRNFSLPLNLAGSAGMAGVAAAATTTFVLSKNGTNFGTMVFAGAAVVSTFTGTATSFVAGDKLIVTAPATPDITLADIGFTLAGAV
jgi:hypothetical protein